MGNTGGKIVIVEFPALAGEAIRLHFDAHTTLRGHVLTLERRGKKANAPVFASFNGLARDIASLPPAPDVKAILRRMWSAGPKKTASKIIVLGDQPVQRNGNVADVGRRRAG